MTIGAPLGVHIIPTGGKDLLTGKVAELCNQRLVLRFPNEDTRRLSMRSGMTSPPPLAGRAIDTGSGRHVQICQPETSAAELAASVAAAYDPAALDPRRLPRRFPSLPSRISVESLKLPSPLPSPSWIPLGVGGPDAPRSASTFRRRPAPDAHLRPARLRPHHRDRHPGQAAELERHRRPRGRPAALPLAGMLAGDDGHPRHHRRVRRGHRASRGRRTLWRQPLRRASRRRGPHHHPGHQGEFAESPTLLDEIAHPSSFGRRALIIAADAAPILSGQRRSLAKPTRRPWQAATASC